MHNPCGGAPQQKGPLTPQTQTRPNRLHTHTHPPKRLAHPPRSPIPPFSTLTSRATHAHPTSPRSTGFCAIWGCISSSLLRCTAVHQEPGLVWRRKVTWQDQRQHHAGEAALPPRPRVAPSIQISSEALKPPFYFIQLPCVSSRAPPALCKAEPIRK